MKRILSMLILPAFLLAGSSSFAQANSSTISGRVTSFEESLALEGVHIYIKGTNKNTGTQADGTFSIDVAPENKTLVFEFREYETLEIDIDDKKQFDVTLKRSSNSGLVPSAIIILPAGH